MWNISAEQVRAYAAQRGPAGVRLVTFASRQPSWVGKAAILAAAIVMTAIVLLLVVPALVIGLVVFAAGALAATVRGRVRRLLAGRRDDGRQNVRVLVRADEPL